MKYPALVTDKEKLETNARCLKDLCDASGVEICAVTKCVCANPEIVDILYSAGIRKFADARVQNLKKMAYVDAEKWLLRISMPSEVEEIVRYADISLNSELSTISLLSDAALRLGKKHGVLLMIDLGDLREGVLCENAVNTAEEIIKLKGVELAGIGTNLNCFGGIIPTVENLTRLSNIAAEIEKKCGITLRIVSGGNSGSIHMITGKIMPEKINNLRLGEAILFGWETSYQQNIEGAKRDVFTLEAQIIELKEKPSVPIGEFGLNAFGEKPIFVERGQMLRAIVACGRQDVSYEQLKPFDEKIEILGSSSDHMILDVTHSATKYRVGDIVKFRPSYGALLSLSTSEYVYKEIMR